MIDPLFGCKTLSEMEANERSEYYQSISDLTDIKFYKGSDANVFETKETIVAYINDNGELLDASILEAQDELRGQKVDVHLNCFYVCRYPGGNKHLIQINISTQHLVQTNISTQYLVQTNISTQYLVQPSTVQDVIYGLITGHNFSPTS